MNIKVLTIMVFIRKDSILYRNYRDYASESKLKEMDKLLSRQIIQAFLLAEEAESFGKVRNEKIGLLS